MSVRLGPRDMWALLWLSQMGGAPMDVVALLLGTSETNAYRVVARWRHAGKLIEESVRPVPGRSWVVPNAATASMLLGFTVPKWMPTPMYAAHETMVARVRLALVGTEFEDSWISERVLRHRNGFRTRPGESMPHLHDAHYTDDQGLLQAVEVELTRKGSAAARETMQAAYSAAHAAGADVLVYYCADADVRSRVVAAAGALTPVPDGPEVRAQDLTKLFDSRATPFRRGLSAAGGAAS